MIGCANPLPLVTTKSEPIHTPESLLAKCPKSQLAGDTYAAAVALAESRGRDLDECNKRFDDIRKWQSGEIHSDAPAAVPATP